MISTASKPLLRRKRVYRAMKWVASWFSWKSPAPKYRPTR